MLKSGTSKYIKSRDLIQPMKFMYRAKQCILLGGDILSFVVAFIMSLSLRYLEVPPKELLAQNFSLFFFLFLLWVLVNYINGLYDLHIIQSKKRYTLILQSAAVSFVMSIIFFYILPQGHITPKTILLLNVAFGYGLALMLRLLYKKFIQNKKLYTNILFLGYTPEVQEIIHILQKETDLGYKICVIIDPEYKIKSPDFPDIDIYHTLQALRPSITTNKIQTVVTAPHIHDIGNATQELYELLFWSVQITDLPAFYENIVGRITSSTFSEGWFLKHLSIGNSPLYTKVRRATDLIAALLIAGILIPLGPLIVILIKLESPGTIIFRQKRVGLGGQTFWIYKFRTMYALAQDGSAETEGAQFASKNDVRVTKVGKVLRKMRLDELPQMVNLLRGELTLIGPRPERPEIVGQLTSLMPYYPLRHTVRPGMTGWAVIHQNYTDTLETSLQKLQYDLYYIKNRSFLLDVAIILKTINVVLRGMGQ